VWAPFAERVQVHLVAPADRVEPLEPIGAGYHEGMLESVSPGARYLYVLDGANERPDPASRFQPEGVHGPSEVVSADFAWTDHECRGHTLSQLIIYELHVGTFTPEGTFDAVIPHLDSLVDLGVTAIEMMPVAQFPGERNWGYDGAYPFAVQGSYGGPEGLRRLVDSAHAHGLSVILDVVYNHLGPEGNYLGQYGPYFTDRYRTPWGSAVNFDGEYSDEVRRYFTENALQWLIDFHIDALRLDAVHAIYDFSASPFLKELKAETKAVAAELGRPFHLIAESDLNDSRLVSPRRVGGYELDGQWADDLHHALHAVLTGESTGYYEDFGSVELLARAYRDAYAYAGQYSKYRKRRHGNSPRLTRAHQFVVCSQNHDQVGNRMLGERLCQLVSFEELKLAAAAILLSPYVPLLFMGEEYGEVAPFLYFTSHGDADLVEAVRRGRREEFAAFREQGEAPDPDAPETFLSSKLRPELAETGQHRVLWQYYRELIRLRKACPALVELNFHGVAAAAFEDERTLVVRRLHQRQGAIFALNFGTDPARLDIDLEPTPRGQPAWRLALNSADPNWGGPGFAAAISLAPGAPPVRLDVPPKAIVLYLHTQEH
jgi:maltooligosyltrehalose trehalohydrolase